MPNQQQSPDNTSHANTICGILCNILAVYKEHVAGRKHKRLAKDSRDGPQSCEPCKQ
jgi:hypothetical protein